MAYLRSPLRMLSFYICWLMTLFKLQKGKKSQNYPMWQFFKVSSPFIHFQFSIRIWSNLGKITLTLSFCFVKVENCSKTFPWNILLKAFVASPTFVLYLFKSNFCTQIYLLKLPINGASFSSNMQKQFYQYNVFWGEIKNQQIHFKTTYFLLTNIT